MLSLTCSRGPAFIAVALPDGRRRLLRRSATDLERPLATQSTPLPRILARALLPLARHIRNMQVLSVQETRHVQPLPTISSAPSKGDTTPPLSAPVEVAVAAGARQELAQQIARVLRRLLHEHASHVERQQ